MFSILSAKQARKALESALPPKFVSRMRYQSHLRRGEPELRFLESKIGARFRVSLDVGANLGIYSTGLSRCSKQVFAFEPNPNVFRKLSQGAAGNVVTLQLSASDAAGPVRLTVPMEGSSAVHWRGTIESSPDIAYNSSHSDVLSARIDDFGLADVDFIKIDTEGHEIKVLSGSMNTIRSCQPLILIESEFRHGAGPRAVIDLLTPLGYRTFVAGRQRSFEVSDKDLDRLEATQQMTTFGSEPQRYWNNFFLVPDRFLSIFA